MSNYAELKKINVNDKIEKKNGLSYLSWAWAWDMFKTAYPDATYKVIKNDNGLPYFETSAGVMVYTEVTAGGLTHEMWLPVMDGANMAMKQEPYKYKTKYGEKTCDAFDMFDVNKTIMRCLVKNLAMFGLGLYIYAGEDLPDDDNGKQSFINTHGDASGQGDTGITQVLDKPANPLPTPERMEALKDIASEIVEFHTKQMFDDAFVVYDNISDMAEREALWLLLKPNSDVRSKLKQIGQAKKESK